MLRLGELERAVMDVLWASDGPVTARAVSDGLADRSLALTTVLTVLSRLEAKGYVARTRDGRAHHYAATATREEHVAGLMHEVLDTAGQSTGDRSAVLARFIGQVSRQEAEALQDALAEALRRKGTAT